VLNWTWGNTAGGHRCEKRNSSFVLRIASSELSQHRRRRQKDCRRTTSSKAKIALTVSQVIFHPFRSSLHPLVACTCYCISVLLSQPPERLLYYKEKKSKWRRSKLCVRLWRANIEDSVRMQFIFQPLQLISNTSSVSHTFWCSA